MLDGRTSVYYVLVVLAASRTGWWVYELVVRRYGPGTETGSLLTATPQAAAAGGIAWLATTVVLALAGVLLVRVAYG